MWFEVSRGNQTLLLFGCAALVKCAELDCHPSLEITYFKDAIGVYTINGVDYEFKDGDVFLMQSNAYHEITHLEKKGTVYNINFEPRFIWDSTSFSEVDDYMRIFRGDPSLFRFRLDRENPARMQVIDLIVRIHDEFIAKDKCYGHMVRIYMQHIFVTIYRNFECCADSDASVGRHNIKAISKSIDYIDEHLCENIKLDDIAGVANVCPTYYGVIFKKLNGITPWEYITSKRILLATEKLEKGECLSMYDLAYSCGFNNTANFNRAFKKYTGTVPSKYFKSKTNANYKED